MAETDFAIFKSTLWVLFLFKIRRQLIFATATATGAKVFPTTLPVFAKYTALPKNCEGRVRSSINQSMTFNYITHDTVVTQIQFVHLQAVELQNYNLQYLHCVSHRSFPFRVQL